MPKKPGGSVSTASVSFVTQGTYQRDLIAMEGVAMTTGTEYEVADVSDVITATTANKDELFSWVRGLIFVYIDNLPSMHEYMLIRMKQADALPDLNDAAAVEYLQKEKRILTRGWIHQPLWTYNSLKAVKFELYNLQVPYGEELRFVVRPLTSTAANGYVRGLLEWRQVGV